MVCKKCNMTINRFDKICKNCGNVVEGGSKVSAVTKLVKFSIVSFIVVVCMSYIVLHFMGVVSFTDIALIFTSSAESEVDEGYDYGVLEVEGSDISDIGMQVIPLADMPDIAEAFSDILSALAVYVENGMFVSNMGFLYDIEANVFVNADRLMLGGVLASSSVEEIYDFMILYLKPHDMLVFDEVSFLDSEQLTLFIGYETITGVMLYSTKGSSLIYRENLNSLLELYMPYNGDIVNVEGRADSLLFEDIQALLENYIELDVFIRYMAIDNAHAFIAASFGEFTHIFHYFVIDIEKMDVVQKLENFTGSLIELKVKINHVIPNFNFELLVGYSFDVSLLLEPLYFEPYIHDMVYENDEIMFVSGTYQGFVYIALQSGARFLGRFENDEWHFGPIDNDIATARELIYAWTGGNLLQILFLE